MATFREESFSESDGRVPRRPGFLSVRRRGAGANPLGMPIGCQTWPVRKMIAKDFPGTIKQLAEAGFQTIELCSPVGYADTGFGGLGKYNGAELRKILGDAGVKCVSSHFGMRSCGRIRHGANCLGKRCRPDSDAGSQPRRADATRRWTT